MIDICFAVRHSCNSRIHICARADKRRSYPCHELQMHHPLFLSFPVGACRGTSNLPSTSATTGPHSFSRDRPLALVIELHAPRRQAFAHKHHGPTMTPTMKTNLSRPSEGGMQALPHGQNAWEEGCGGTLPEGPGQRPCILGSTPKEQWIHSRLSCTASFHLVVGLGACSAPETACLVCTCHHNNMSPQAMHAVSSACCD